MPKIIELKVDRSLMKPNFDGYKLSLEKIPIVKQDLKCSVFKSKQNSNQFSIHHLELFSMMNLLIQDPWNRSSSYFISIYGELMKLTYNETVGRPEPIQIVLKISGISAPQPGDYNLSFQFISEKYCIICDGKNRLLIVETSDRYKSQSEKWKIVHETQISSEYENFVLKDSRLDIEDGHKVINCCFQHIDQDENGAHSNKVLCFSIKLDNDFWGNLELRDILCGKGTIQYCVFEPKAGSVIMSTSKEFFFNSVGRPENAEKSEIKEPTDLRYTWEQNNEDVFIKLTLLENENKNSFKISSTDDTLTIQGCNDEIILDQNLFAKIDSSLTTWNWEDIQLVITLVKLNANQLWAYLVADGPKETVELDVSTEIAESENHAISSLEELEECDFPIGILEDEYAIDRYNLDTKTISHRVLLGNTPLLFSTILRPGFPSAFATRYDVDATLWLHQFNPSKPTEFNFRNDGNLYALGYIQASKKEKKFFNCAPDLNYSVICESYRHIFIYKSRNDSAGGLRNRTGSNITIGKQHLVTLENTYGEVYGMTCDNNILTLLTENCVLYLQINCS